MQIRLSEEEISHLREDLGVADETSVPSSYAWSRRKYAPMHIHSPHLSRLREQIRASYPEYVIAFDVVFEVEAGAGVDLHCDYESLGPFEYDRARAISESHFRSLHFNLTEEGGSLVTLPWPRLSLLHHWVLSRFGLYSGPHRVCNWFARPLVAAFGVTHPNEAGVGNGFDNLRLHMVTPGKRPRASYVVRLVKRGGLVRTSPPLLALSPAPASRVLHRAIARHVREVTDVERVPWSRLREEGGEEEREQRETVRRGAEEEALPHSPLAPRASPLLQRA